MTDRPRLIVSDLDGTFLDPLGRVTQTNRDAVHDAVAAGIEVIFATGRPPRWLDVIADLPVGHPLVIASNGALLWDLADQAPIHSHPIDPDLALSVMSDVRKVLPEVTFAIEGGLRFGYEPAYDWYGEVPGGDRYFPASGTELVTTVPFVKMLVQHLTMPSEPLAQAASEIIGDALQVTHSSFHDTIGLLELSAPGVTKASMLQEWCQEKGIDAADVAAFGDMPNDLEMLGWVGQPHIMGESHPSLEHVVGATGQPAVRVGSNAESAVGRRIHTWL